MRRHRAAWTMILAVACAGCVPSGHLDRYRAPIPTFDPLTFFVGETEGRGTLTVMLHPRQPTFVEGTGRRDGDGGIVLDQTVRRGTSAPTRRTWHLHLTGPGRYAGTLTDASGPVEGEASGNLLHLSFPMRGGLLVQQWLYLQSGGRSAVNRLVVTKAGIPVASLDETITHTDVTDHAVPR